LFLLILGPFIVIRTGNFKKLPRKRYSSIGCHSAKIFLPAECFAWRRKLGTPRCFVDWCEFMQ